MMVKIKIKLNISYEKLNYITSFLQIYCLGAEREPIRYLVM